MRSGWLVQKVLDGMQAVMKPEKLVILQVGHTVTVPAPGATGHHSLFSFTNQVLVFDVIFVKIRGTALAILPSVLSHSFASRQFPVQNNSGVYFHQLAIRACQSHHWFHGFSFSSMTEQSRFEDVPFSVPGGAARIWRAQTT